jgi:hypothetical protein
MNAFKNRSLVAVVIALSSLASLAQAGPVRDNVFDDGRVQAHSTVTYTEVFVGGASASIELSGDGDTDLDLFVLDSAGNVIASNTNYTDKASLTFTPSRTGPLRIVVENLGDVYNDYTIWAW